MYVIKEGIYLFPFLYLQQTIYLDLKGKGR